MTALADMRAELAERLEGPWQVFELMPDAIPGPCLAVVLNPFALEPLGMCNYNARADVLCVAGRLAVEEAQTLLDEMTEYVLERVRITGTYVIERGGGDELTSWAGVDHLMRRITVLSVIKTGRLVPGPT
jgi:hypothetical protein